MDYIDYSNYVINCTNTLNLNNNVIKTFKKVSEQLKYIKSLDNSISEIGIAGGFVIDTMLGLKPSDVDIKYSIKNKNGEILRICKCNEIMKLVVQTDLPKTYKIDLGSIKESNNDFFDSIKEKHLGIFSVHTEYISQFTLDENGQVWSNQEALKDYISKIYNPRIEGFMSWVFYEKKSYYEAFTIMLLRGFSYVLKRNLKMGDKFKYYITQAPTIFDSYSKEDRNHTKMINYFNDKIGTLDSLDALLVKHQIESKEEVLSAIEAWFRKHSL